MKQKSLLLVAVLLFTAISSNAQNIFPSTGNVGLGTVTPAFQLHLQAEYPTIILVSTAAAQSAAIRGNNATWIMGWNGANGSEDISIGTQDHTGSRTLTFAAGGYERMKINADGTVGIGTSDTKGYKFAVNGSAVFTKVKVKTYTNWPDYVFHQDYKLPSLQEVEKFIVANKHLPEMPSANTVAENGLDLGEMNAKLLQKVEELTLYLIEQNKKLELQQKEIDLLKKKL